MLHKSQNCKKNPRYKVHFVHIWLNIGVKGGAGFGHNIIILMTKTCMSYILMTCIAARESNSYKNTAAINELIDHFSMQFYCYIS